MAEPDHVYIKPLPNLSRGGNPAAFPFFYITPAQHEKIVRKFYPEEKGPVSNVDPIGNSPVIIKKVVMVIFNCLKHFCNLGAMYPCKTLICHIDLCKVSKVDTVVAYSITMAK
jgi:hypothetical protein